MKANTAPRCNARRRRGAAKNIIAPLSCLYQHVEERGLVGEKGNPVGVDKPYCKPPWWCQLIKKHLSQG